MFFKKVNVVIQKGSWKKGTLPVWAKNHRAVQSVDVGKALLTLGSLTTPGGLSAVSPERYWACVRYFSACATGSDLRIAEIFTELDPHQRAILSDDFGVAISTTWLMSQLGGTRSISDGRSFAANMLSHKTKGLPPKVGPRKCPDFVLEDAHHKFHVLECKGTQSGRSYLNKAMNNGQLQKAGIKVKKRFRGESLVIGLSLLCEPCQGRSQLVVRGQTSKVGALSTTLVVRRLSQHWLCVLQRERNRLIPGWSGA